MKRIIKIGTRESQLAVWQAKYIENFLNEKGIETELVYIKSAGELDLVSPLYEMGVQGIFTKALDISLLNKTVDIAVHSLKDIPTQLPMGLVLAAIPPRASWKDLLVTEQNRISPDISKDFIVATSSLRRKAQWLNKYPTHKTTILRGNINTRLEKLKSTKTWGGALFAAAGVERINLEVPLKIELDWMLPAPAQGALGVVCRENDLEVLEMSAALSHEYTKICVTEERQFLRTLMGGCTMPIAALAQIRDEQLFFKGNVLTVDGLQRADVEMSFSLEDAHKAGNTAAKYLLKNKGKSIVQSFKNIKP